MQLTAASSSDEVMAHHPHAARVMDRILDPNHRPVNPGAPGALEALDRVVMRRHLRQFFPGYCAIVQVRDLDREQLVATINRLRAERSPS